MVPIRAGGWAGQPWGKSIDLTMRDRPCCLRSRRQRPRGGRTFMNRITGRSAFLALLKDEGITHLFGNPGTTELPIMHALRDHPDLTYVMAMQESLAAAIAGWF